MTSDFQRLIQLCGSYGLNQQQTNQIISDFKNGSFVQQDQSIDESFQQSLRQMDTNSHGGEEYSKSMNENYGYTGNYCSYEQEHEHEHGQNQNEEYSFKNQKNMTANFYQNTGNSNNNSNNKHMVSNNDSLEQDSKRQKFPTQNLSTSNSTTSTNKSKQIVVNPQMLQSFITERRQFQKNIYKKMQQEISTLKQALKQKQQQITIFIKLKQQDSQVIHGLKDSLTNMAHVLNERDRDYRDLLEKYEKVKMDNQNISTQKSSNVQQLSLQQSLGSLEERKSLVKQKQKQNCLNESQNNKIFKKSSQKYIKQLPNNRNQNIIPSPNLNPTSTSNNLILKDNINITNINNKITDRIANLQQNRQILLKNDQSKRSGIDINKYKGMIQKLRNSYQFR